MDIDSDNAAWNNHIANVNAMPSAGMSEGDYWNGPAPTQADRYAAAYGGEATQAGGRIRLPAGWSMRGDRMIAPDGTDMGTMSGSGTVNINIRDGQAASQYNDTFRTENLDRALALLSQSKTPNRRLLARK